MDKITPSQEKSKSSSSITEAEFLAQTQTLPSVASSTLISLMKCYGFHRVLMSLLVRWRYMFKVWLLREIAIRKILSDNLSKISEKRSYRIAKFYASIPLAKKLLLKLEKWSLHGVIMNS